MLTAATRLAVKRSKRSPVLLSTFNLARHTRHLGRTRLRSISMSSTSSTEQSAATAAASAATASTEAKAEAPEPKEGPLPMLLEAEIIQGFGRGSTELGIPTANMKIEDLETKLSHHTGIYFGWAQRSGGSDPSRLYKSAVSIGWNPYYKNKKKTIEPHLIHDFKGEKFYGETLKLMICGFLRPEKNFNGLDELVAAIKQDIENSSTRLDEKEYQELRKSKFWGWKEGNSAVPSTADTAKEGAAAAASKEA